jgi:hypothetical protein
MLINRIKPNEKVKLVPGSTSHIGSTPGMTPTPPIKPNIQKIKPTT